MYTLLQGVTRLFQYISPKEEGAELMVFRRFRRFNGLKAAFTTRLGGVSSGGCATLNLSFKREPSEELVRENFRRVAKAMEIDYYSIVCGGQVHETRVGLVSREHAGTGVTKPLVFDGYDALITNEVNLPLCTIHADCIPVLFYDPVHHAAGTAHSGWRGTKDGIAGKVVSEMQRVFGSDPAQLQVVIGPGICRGCFAVDEDVYRAFYEAYGMSREIQDYLGPHPTQCGKWQIDLKAFVRHVLLAAGVPAGNIDMTEACTCCDGYHFFSHRRDKGNNGAMASFICLCR